MTLVEMVNWERAKRGLRPLAIDERLMRAAQLHSAHQAEKKEMTHIGECESTVGGRLTAQGHADWHRCTENVAWNYIDEQTVMQGWMESPGHSANILDVGVTHVGWGRVGAYWTQVFAG